MSRPHFLSRLRMVLLAAAVLPAGCAAPGLTGNPPNLSEGGLPAVSVCYSPLATSRQAGVQLVALAACRAAGVADAELRKQQRSLFLNECPLFRKAAITFTCEPAANAD